MNPQPNRPARTALIHHINKKETQSMYRTIRAVFGVALAAVSIFAFSATALTATASAGTVGVSPNFYSNLSHGFNGWGYGFQDWNIYLGPTNGQGTAVGSPGTVMWVRSQQLPANVNLNKIYNSVRYRSPAGSSPFHARMCGRGIVDINTGACGSIASDHVNWPSTSNSISTGSGGMQCFSLNCDAVQLEVNTTYSNGASPSYTNGFMEFTGVSAELADNTAPTANPAYNGNALGTSNWLRGSVAGGVSIADTAGVGVRDTTLVVDGNDTASNNFSCNYSTWIPCPQSATWSPSFNTASYSDGPHTISYRSTDAANTTGTTPNHTIKVDNTKPATPTTIEPVTNGMNGWSSVNNIGATWTNTGETDETQTKSGLKDVVVDVNPTSPGQSDPAPVSVPIGGSASGISATIDSVSGVTVPTNGAWTLRLSTVDRAGNTSEVGDGNNGNPDSDIEIGVDPNTPTKAIGNANGWVSREELATGRARQTWQNVQPMTGAAPICGWAVSVSDNEGDAGGTNLNVAAPATEWVFPSDLTEGKHYSHIRAIACNGLASSQTDSHDVDVDLTDPTGSITGVEDGHWYRDGQQVTLHGADALSGMAAAPNTEQDSTTGAYLSYELNGAGPADADSPRGDSATISVTGEGQKTLKLRPVDFAGNRANAVTASFGIDATNPEGFIEAQDPERPTLIRAALADGVSGVASALVQVRSTGGGSWTSLPTSLASFSGGQVNGYAKSAIAEARFPDTKLADGNYQVRTLAYDQAGNELATSKNKDGSEHVVANPMRTGVGLTAAVFRGLHKCKRKVKAKCVKKKRGRVYLVGGKTFTSVGYRRAGVVQGYLTTSNYRGIFGQHISIYTKAQGKAEELAGVASTKRDGSYYFRLKPGVSRSVRVVFDGTELLKNAEARVTFGTAAKLRLSVSKRHVRTGGKVTFKGRVIAYDKTYPQAGKIVVLQYLTGGKWRPAVAIVRTDSKGNFKVSYRFDRIPRNVKARIKFRIYAPKEIGFSHSSSASRTKIVKVN